MLYIIPKRPRASASTEPAGRATGFARPVDDADSDAAVAVEESVEEDASVLSVVVTELMPVELPDEPVAEALCVEAAALWADRLQEWSV